jgi:hypothetical protein
MGPGGLFSRFFLGIPRAPTCCSTARHPHCRRGTRARFCGPNPGESTGPADRGLRREVGARVQQSPPPPHPLRDHKPSSSAPNHHNRFRGHPTDSDERKPHLPSHEPLAAAFHGAQHQGRTGACRVARVVLLHAAAVTGDVVTLGTVQEAAWGLRHPHGCPHPVMGVVDVGVQGLAAEVPPPTSWVGAGHQVRPRVRVVQLPVLVHVPAPGGCEVAGGAQEEGGGGGRGRGLTAAVGPWGGQLGGGVPGGGPRPRVPAVISVDGAGPGAETWAPATSTWAHRHLHCRCSVRCRPARTTRDDGHAGKSEQGRSPHGLLSLKRLLRFRFGRRDCYFKLCCPARVPPKKTPDNTPQHMDGAGDGPRGHGGNPHGDDIRHAHAG